jgi:hypothetical protein
VCQRRLNTAVNSEGTPRPPKRHWSLNDAGMVRPSLAVRAKLQADADAILWSTSVQPPYKYGHDLSDDRSSAHRGLVLPITHQSEALAHELITRQGGPGPVADIIS